MAAVDNFRQFNATLTEGARSLLSGLIRETTEQLLAARSEDARKRIVEEFLLLVHEQMEMSGEGRRG
jgi:hypothetical protein